MRFNELVLHNFGLYRERQTIDLSPDGSDRPIILIGGLNGGGKTTILDAIQLALYGQRAQLSNREGKSWPDYLRSTIHRGVPISQGASVELELVVDEGLDLTTYRVARSWAPNGSQMKEHLQVYVNGEASKVATSSWATRVEELIPAEMSGLFLFDGEKIETLANPAKSGPIVESAIRGLLGAGLVDQLTEDLAQIARRQRKALATQGMDTSLLTKLEAELEDAEKARLHAVQQLAKQQVVVDSARKARKQADQAHIGAGGDLAERRVELEASLNEARKFVQETEDRLSESAWSSLPLNLLGDELGAINTQLQVEMRSSADQGLLQELKMRDEQTLALLEELKTGADVASQIQAFLDTDREKRSSKAADPVFSEIADLAASLNLLLTSRLEADGKTALTALEDSQIARGKLEEARQHLEQLPSSDEIKPLVAARDAAALKEDEALSLLNDHQTELDRLSRLKERCETAVEREATKLSEQRLDIDRANRMLSYSMRSRDALRKFRQLLVEKHAARIEASIMESLTELLRKKELIGGLSLDPETFTIQLQDRYGNPLPADRLSAGERQLLATATLWGLARIARRSIPTVIDTPLGRLDSVHRRILADQYFPHASHQVILLSTDEEIDEALFNRISPHVGRTYTVSNDEAEDCSTISEGYLFSKENEHVA